MDDGKKPTPPPASLPDFVTGSIVPPKPPVLKPNVGDIRRTSPTPNPFAAQPFVPIPPKATPKADAPLGAPQPPATLPLNTDTNNDNKPQPAVSPKIEIPLSPPQIEATNIDSPKSPPEVTKKPIEETPKNAPASSSNTAPEENRIDMTGSLMSWITKTVAESKLLSNVAEKAKHGMEQVLTTLDPGMRSFLNDDGVMDVYMVAADAQQLRAVKEGFERVFADVLIHAVPAAKGDLPEVVAGLAKSLDICKERAKRIQSSKLAPASSAVLTMQPFVVTLNERHYAGSRILLSWKQFEFDAVSQLLEVDPKIMRFMEKRSKGDGKTNGDFTITVSQAAKEVLQLETESWAGPSPPYSFSELIIPATSSVALQFMNMHIELTNSVPETPVSPQT